MLAKKMEREKRPNLMLQPELRLIVQALFMLRIRLIIVYVKSVQMAMLVPLPEMVNFRIMMGKVIRLLLDTLQHLCLTQKRICT